MKQREETEFTGRGKFLLDYQLKKKCLVTKKNFPKSSGLGCLCIYIGIPDCDQVDQYNEMY